LEVEENESQLISLVKCTTLEVEEKNAITPLNEGQREYNRNLI
jgi:hypothetical protein